MRLIHEVIEHLRALPDGSVTPMSAALLELLGGGRGSIPELVDRFTAAGLAPVMASWMGNGPNLPISTHDLRRILGKERVDDLATLAGLPAGEFLVRLARLLPVAIHRMTSDAGSEAASRSGRPREP